MNSEQANQALVKVCTDFIDMCPHCGSKAHLVMISNEYYANKTGDQLHYVLFRCKPCQKITLEVFKFRQNPYSDKQNLSGEGWIAKYPNTKTEASEKVNEYVPADAVEDYEEGLRCLAANSPKGAVSMFRRALQSSMLNLGADKELHLIVQIGTIERLTDDIKDWAHNIRIFGNWGAHPHDDLLKDVDMDKAAEAKDFTDEFFNYVYVMPGKVRAARQVHEKTDEKV